MLDPFSLTAGIAGLISLTFQATKIVADYTSSVTQAATESQELAVELATLALALRTLDQFLDRDGAKFKSLKNTSVLYSVTSTCHAKLNSLHSILQKFMERSEGKKWYRSAAWPIKRDEHIQTITTLHRCMQIFQFSLSVDGW